MELESRSFHGPWGLCRQIGRQLILLIEWIRAIVVLMGIYSSESFQLMSIESKYPWEVASVPKNSNTTHVHILEKPSWNKWCFSVLILKRILKNMNDKNQLQGQSLKLKWSFGMLGYMLEYLGRGAGGICYIYDINY